MRSHLVALAGALACAGLPFSAAGAELAQLPWRNLGPAVSGGRVAAVAGTNRDPALYYAGAADGGVWKSTNAGQSWTAVFDDEDVQAIGAIAIDPNDAATVWVGTGEANPRNDVIQGDGVYETTDGAKTWTRVLALRNSTVSAVLIDPRDSKRVLIGTLGDPFADGTERGVYRTTDGGKTWAKVLYLAPDSGVSDMAMSASDPDVVYAGMWEYRRTGWSSQSGGPNDGIYRSADGGATWAKLSGGGLPNGPVGRIGLAIAPSNPQRIYALIQSKAGLLWRSDDGGATWAMVSDDSLMNERPFYFSHVFVDPTDADHLWSASVHLTESVDGGKTFKMTAGALHVDNHSLWIAADGKRIVEGNDGGVGLSFDGGASWTWDNNLPVSQLYRVGYSSGDEYDVCAPTQDNSTWCAPSNPLDAQGMSASQWRFAGVAGDGAWAVVDPTDPARVWVSFGGSNNAGDVYIHDYATGETRSIAPYLRDQNVFPPAEMLYRFDWETPIAFDPFDPHRAFVGGNVLFASSDDGSHWRAVSGDLTRNERSHEAISGGVTLEGTGSETSDAILDIAPSRAARGEIWIGTDDGYLQLTRDGGVHWHNVTPPGIGPWGRFGAISPSPTDPGTSYAAYDRHLVGDRTPYAFVTHDFGAHWSSIAAGLPAGDEVRSLLLDPRNQRVLYAGLDRSLWVSWDAGTHWERLTGIPAASVRDIQLQPALNDLLVATHGRGLYVLDDAAPLEQHAQAVAAGTYLFPVRPATLWGLNSYWNTDVDGTGPPYGAIVTYYLSVTAMQPPAAEIVDAHGRIVRSFSGIRPGSGTDAVLSGDAGYNRFSWDLTSAPAHAWIFAPKWNSTVAGVPLPPGTYAVRLHLGAKTLERRIVVRPDPRLRYTQQDYERSYGLQERLLDDVSKVDDALNVLDTVATEAPLRAQALRVRNETALAVAVSASGAAAQTFANTMSANLLNDQDDDFLRDLLRERLQALLGTFTSFAPPTAEQTREAGVLHTLVTQRLAAYAAYAAALDVLDAKVRAAALPSLRHLSHPPDPQGQGDGFGKK